MLSCLCNNAPSTTNYQYPCPKCQCCRLSAFFLSSYDPKINLIAQVDSFTFIQQTAKERLYNSTDIFYTVTLQDIHLFFTLQDDAMSAVYITSRVIVSRFNQYSITLSGFSILVLLNIDLVFIKTSGL